VTSDRQQRRLTRLGGDDPDDAWLKRRTALIQHHHAALNHRMVDAGWFVLTQSAGDKVETVPHDLPEVGRNEPCPCGNGRKFKQCHGA
jgi:uncharacterized protein YecA (UPF0149 family)